MPLPVIPGVLRSSIGGTVDGGGRWSNTWHFRRSSLATPTESDIGALHTILAAFYTVGIWGLTTSGTSAEAGDYTPLDGTSGAYHYPIGAVGSAPGGAMPAEVAEVLTIRTGARGRRARGRVFLPAFSRGTFSVTGHIDPTTVPIVTAALAVMTAAMDGAGWEYGVASYGKSVKVNYLTNPPTKVETLWDPFFTPGTSITMDDVADVQRSRKR